MDSMLSTTDPGELLSNLLLCDGDLNGINNDTIGILYPDIENILNIQIVHAPSTFVLSNSNFH
ncbi:hypothetical protein GYMLUDRAFT_906217 [Collybiopsis luxurians FD-317 M1]|uniref:Uncharacterized protein n=1 Tax=Collybiopsis luxurians FD-317 M1 TaxID=944289 RepID=A0A0D0AUR3_9AGAR|nr:hypothetical protein GYMLUDRAFT_906217 [Collybiopsis luxurians FD-317 M1]